MKIVALEKILAKNNRLNMQKIAGLSQTLLKQRIFRLKLFTEMLQVWTLILQN